MGKLIGREKQVWMLQEALKSDKSELVSLYGRRRVGKTFLIRETYKKKLIFEVSGIFHGSYNDQLANFHHELNKNKKTENKTDFTKNWFEAFKQLEKFLDNSKGKDKKVVFFDEFPWMCTPKSKFIQMFGHFWNNYCTKRKDLVVVICGSAASFMVNNVMKDKGSLHNRITVPMRLSPFNLHETELFLKSKKINLSRYDYLQLYMAIGGIPHYLEKIEAGDSIPVILEKLCFQKDGLLKNEFNQIFSSLFENSEYHIQIIETLATIKKGLGRQDLVEKTGIPSGGTLTKILSELTESGFLTEYLPFKNKKKDVIYRLTDEYSIFYLKFIRDSAGRSWKHFSSSRSYASWSGFAFENVCLKHINQIKRGLGISGIDSQNFSWRNTNAQIDLLIDRSDNCVNICEIKFSNTEFKIDKRYFSNLENKKLELQRSTLTRKNVFITLITTNGVIKNNYSDIIMDNQLTMDYLFENDFL